MQCECGASHSNVTLGGSQEFFCRIVRNIDPTYQSAAEWKLHNIHDSSLATRANRRSPYLCRHVPGCRGVCLSGNYHHWEPAERECHSECARYVTNEFRLHAGMLAIPTFD